MQHSRILECNHFSRLAWIGLFAVLIWVVLWNQPTVGKQLHFMAGEWKTQSSKLMDAASSVDNPLEDAEWTPRQASVVEDLVNLRANYMSIPRQARTKFVLVVGLESSGSKLAAKLIAMRFGPGEDAVEWSGHRHFLTIHKPDRSAGLEKSGTVVVHRSLPHWDFFPDVESMLAQALCDGFKEAYMVVATRDRHISFRSKLATHQSDSGVAAREQVAAQVYLRSVLSRGLFPTFVFSYESLMLLGPPYVHELYAFVGERLHGASGGQARDPDGVLVGADKGIKPEDDPRWQD